MKCRHCSALLTLPLIDLDAAPPSNSYLSTQDLSQPETWYPLRVLVCDQCWLVQTEDFAARDTLFSKDYAYFSSFSQSWLAHAKAYVDAVVDRFHLNATSHVIELASNDGYLLQYVQARAIPCLGIEPTTSTANAARAKGIAVVEAFFGRDLAQHLVDTNRAADLVVANNVLAHVPDINDFVAGVVQVLKPGGVATFEFPHLLQLIDGMQFDTIYHEHFSYLSLTAVETIFKAHGLALFDVEALPTHGGSLRVFAQSASTPTHSITAAVARTLENERAAGVKTQAYYQNMQHSAEKISRDLLAFLLEAQRTGKRVAAYGAAAKGNTLLNFAGIRRTLLPWVVDRNPAKQGKFLPGSRIPIVSEERISQDKPDYILLLPWNLRDELRAQLAFTKEWGARLVCAIPELQVL